MENKIKKEELSELNRKLYDVILFIKMFNNWIDLVPDPRKMTVDERELQYCYTYRALDDLFVITQRNINELDEVANFLLELQDMLEQ